MGFDQKLDMLQEVAITCTSGSHELFLVQLVAEHAEDSDMTADFLSWLKSVLFRQT